MQHLGDRVIGKFEEYNAKALQETQEMLKDVNELLKNISTSLAENRTETSREFQRLQQVVEPLDVGRLIDHVKEATGTMLQNFQVKPSQQEVTNEMLQEILLKSQQHIEALGAENSRAQEVTNAMQEFKQMRKDVTKAGDRLKKLAAATQVIQVKVDKVADMQCSIDIENAFARQNEFFKEQLQLRKELSKDSFLQGELQTFFHEELQRLCQEAQHAKAESAQVLKNAQQAKEHHDGEILRYREEIQCLTEGITRFRALAAQNNIDWQRGQTLGASLWLKQFACRQSLELNGVDTKSFEVQDEASHNETLRSLARC